MKISEKQKGRYIYDADKAKYYKNLQDLYNYNAFGYGLQGRPTRFDPSTPDMLTYASQHYAPDTNMDNMYQFLSGIKDWDVAAQYLSKHSLKNGGKL